MTTDQRFALLISAMTLLFAMTTALMGVVVRITMRWTRTEDKLTGLIDDVRELVIRKEADHHEIKERLTYLEREQLKRYRARH